VDELLSEKEQIEQIRQWWKENGAWVVGGLVLGLALLVGWNSWQSYVKTRAEEASSLYEQVRVETAAGNTDKASELTAELRSDFAATPYADQASLELARLLVERGNLDEAAAALEFVVSANDDPQMSLVARARLAQVRMQQGKFDEAVEALKVDDAGAFAPRFNELRGDIAVARGDLETARNEYEAVLSNLDAGPVNREVVEIKLNDLPQPELVPADPES
jgi:predicted negative regulator of RcsB-dependent stress response